MVLYKDGSLSVGDDGRGMPVDIHPEQGVPGVEVILSTLHAGGKFSNDNYQFSGGLHGVGASVVNALSTHLEVEVKRNGQLWRMTFADGHKRDDLQIVGDCAKRATGTVVRFRPDPKYFDSPKVSLTKLKHVLRAKAVLCPGLHLHFHDVTSGERLEWHYQDGLRDYLVEATDGWM